MAGPILSSLLCSLSSCAILPDAILLLLPPSLGPQVERRHRDRSRAVRLYGPLTGLPNADLFGGLLVLCVFLPVTVFVWAPATRPKLALTTCACLAAAQPLLCLVGFGAALCRLPPRLGSLALAALSGIFGLFGLLWRLLEHDASGLDGRNVPLVVHWHVLWSAIAVGYVLKIKSRLLSLRSSIKLQLQTEEALRTDPRVTRPAGSDFPSGFVSDPIELEAMSNIEQASARYTQRPFVAACILLLVLSFVWGADSEKGQELHDVHGHRLALFVTLPIILLWITALSVTAITYEPFEPGQAAREPLVASDSARMTYA